MCVCEGGAAKAVGAAHLEVRVGGAPEVRGGAGLPTKRWPAARRGRSAGPGVVGAGGDVEADQGRW